MFRALVLRTCFIGCLFCSLLCYTRPDRVSMLLCVKYRYLYLSAHCDTASLIHTWDTSLNICFLSKVIKDFLGYYFLLCICLMWLSLVLRTLLDSPFIVLSVTEFDVVIRG